MYNLGIDIGGTFIKIAVVAIDDNNIPSIVKKGKIPFVKGSVSRNFKDINEYSVQLLFEVGIEKKDIYSIGLSVPGSVDSERGILVDAYNINYHNIDVKKEISAYYPDQKIFIANDANAAALAELHFGAFRNRKSALLLTLGTGLGGGFILDKKIFNGGSDHGFEPGHITYEKGGLNCTCGKKGCAEAYLTSNWIKNRGAKVFGEACSDARYVVELAKEGDASACAIIDEYMDNLANIISGLCNMFDPEIVALGGGIGESGIIDTKALTKSVRDRLFSKYSYPIVLAELGNDAGCIGASILCLN